jgi:hypothetical protein
MGARELELLWRREIANVRRRHRRLGWVLLLNFATILFNVGVAVWNLCRDS